MNHQFRDGAAIETAKETGKYRSPRATNGQRSGNQRTPTACHLPIGWHAGGFAAATTVRISGFWTEPTHADRFAVPNRTADGDAGRGARRYRPAHTWAVVAIGVNW
jgi:hypothetical protein